MKELLEFKSPSTQEMQLYEKYYDQKLLSSLENLKHCLFASLVCDGKIKNEREVDKIESIDFIEKDNKRTGKHLCFHINGKIYNLSSLTFHFKCPSCREDKKVVGNPSRGFSRFRSFFCERCFKSSFYKTEEYRKKITDTMIERYGHSSPIMVPEIKQRISETMIKRYGVPYSAMSPTLHQKSVFTTRERYGDQNIFGHSIAEKQFATQVALICNQLNLSAMSCLNENKKIYIEKQKYCVIDFFIPDINLAIEFYGDFFHGNPAVYSECDIVGFRGLTRKQQNQKDKKRINQIKKAGIETIVVWEKSWKNDFEKTLSKIRNKIINAKKCKNALVS